MKKTLRRYFLQSVAIMVAVTTLAACGSSAGTTSTTAPAGTTTTASATTEEAVTTEPVVDRSQQLVVYSNSTANGQDEWLYQEAEKAGFNLEIISLGAGELTDRLVAEKDGRICDVVFGLNSVEYAKLKRNDLLTPYVPEWAEKVDATLGDKDGYYWPIIVQPLVMAYNPEFVSNPPKDWVDAATNPEYKDKYIVLALGGGTSKTIFSSIVSRYADPNGELGISEEGWEIAKQYIQNAHIAVGDEDWVGELCDGTYPISMLWGSGVVKYEAERETDFGIVCPDYGVPYVVEQMCIINGTEKQDLALDFINWFGSAEVMKGWSAAVGATPANVDAMKDASNEVKELMDSVHPQDVDWALIAEYQDQWMEKVNLEFVNQ